MTKFEKCEAFFNELASLMENYEIVASCNNDRSAYLIPSGSIGALTYSSKPDRSFRISDHWNWYANVRKCEDEHYIQCYSIDAPWPNKRKGVGLASEPKYAVQVGYFGDDKKYHCVYGERFDRKTKRWEWVESSPEDVMEDLR